MYRYILIIVTFIAALFMYPTTQGSTITSEFECHNTDATTTFYSYFKEPKLQESGYTRGLKTGTFNYLKNGEATLKHTLTYYDGHIDANHPKGSDTNSSIISKIMVDFAGESGISEYYAKGFYPNNRAISAFKKIWSIDFTKDWMLGGEYKSSYINVVGSAKLGPNMTGGDYRFQYHAKVKDGYLELKDSTGWTNRTGARRIDWEQDAAMKGKELDVTNNLEADSLYRPSAGLIEDWLPCSCNGTVPEIEGLGSGWPSSGVKATLKPDMKRPDNKCTPYKCTECNPPGSCGTCDSNGCPSFPAIYAFGESGVSGSSALSSEELKLLETGVRMAVNGQFGKLVNGKVKYLILVKNTGEISVDSVNLKITLPPGSYISAKSKEPIEPQSDTWTIGSLAPSESYDLELELVPKPNFDQITDEKYQKEYLRGLVLTAFGSVKGQLKNFPGQSSPSNDWEDGGF
jgi:hypothetical protein